MDLRSPASQMDPETGIGKMILKGGIKNLWFWTLNS